LVDIGLHLGIRQRVGSARRAGRGREDDADRVAVEVDQWSAGVPRDDPRLDDPDIAHHETLTVDVATLGSDLPVYRGSNAQLRTAARVANRRPLRALARP